VPTSTRFRRPLRARPRGLAELVADLGEPAYRADQIHGWLVRGVDDPDEMTDLPTSLRVGSGRALRPVRARAGRASGRRRRAHPQAAAALPRRRGDRDRPDALSAPGDGVHLDPGGLRDGVPVLRDRAGGVPAAADRRRGRPPGGRRRRRAALGCDRREAPARRRPDHVTNVVYMGMGEPLANLPATLASVRWLHDPEGFDLSARRSPSRRSASSRGSAARRARAAGDPGGQPARRHRRPARRARPDQRHASARRAGADRCATTAAPPTGGCRSSGA
jgi:23S rRNA (adenine2503-C2)-methyltransferase